MTESLNSSYKPNGPESELTMNELFGEIRSMLGTSSNKQIVEYLLEEEVFSLIKSNKERFEEEFIPFILSSSINSQIKSSLEEKDEFIWFENLTPIAKDLGDEVYEIVGPLITGLNVDSRHRQLITLVSKGKLLNLTTLDISWNLMGDEEAKALAESPHLANLTTLDIVYNRVGDEGAVAIANSPYLTNLTTLDVGYNNIGDEGAKALADSPHLAKLTTLDINSNAIGDEGAKALVESPHLVNLTHLNLEGNNIGDEGAMALIESPHLANLTTFKLSGYNLSQGMKDELTSRCNELGIKLNI